jgi:hypothetical protein
VRLSDARGFRRITAGLCLIAGPLLLVAATLVAPEGSEETEEYLARLAAESDRATISTALSFAGFLLLVPGVFGIIHLLRHRAVALAHVGGVLAVIGVVSFAALTATGFYDIELAERPARALGVEILDEVEEGVGVFVVLIPALVGTSLGLLLLSIALWRAEVVPPLVPLLVLAGLAVLNTGSTETWVAAVGSGLLAAGLLFVAAAVLGQSDDEWGRAPGTGGPVVAPP